MIDLLIPGYGWLSIKNLLLDYNGTIAFNGHILPGVLERLKALSKLLNIKVVTSDTFGTVMQELEDSDIEVFILKSSNHTAEKREILDGLGANRTIAIGNGNNDKEMIKYAALGIVVLGQEGCSTETLLSSQIVVPSITRALELLLEPEELVATLRR